MKLNYLSLHQSLDDYHVKQDTEDLRKQKIEL